MLGVYSLDPVTTIGRRELAFVIAGFACVCAADDMSCDDFMAWGGVEKMLAYEKLEGGVCSRNSIDVRLCHLQLGIDDKTAFEGLLATEAMGRICGPYTPLPCQTRSELERLVVVKDAESLPFVDLIATSDDYGLCGVVDE